MLLAERLSEADEHFAAEGLGLLVLALRVQQLGEDVDRGERVARHGLARLERAPRGEHLVRVRGRGRGRVRVRARARVRVRARGRGRGRGEG